MASDAFDREFAGHLVDELLESLDEFVTMSTSSLIAKTGLSLDVAAFARELRRWKAQHL